MTQRRICVACFLACLTLCAFTASADELRLDWGHYLSNGTFLEVERDFAKSIESRTNGRVKFNMVFSGGLGTGGELLRLAGRDAIDLGAIVPGYYASELLYAKTLQIPFVFDSPVEAIAIAEYSYKHVSEFRDELAGLNVIRLFHQALGSYYLVGPSDDCKSLEGLKGKSIRSFGSEIPHMMTAVNATPRSVSAGDQYEALERGMLDYGFANLGTIEMYRLYEPGSFICGPVISMAGHVIVIGEVTWRSLPHDVRTIFREEATAAQRQYVKWVERSEAEAGARITAAGGTIIKFSDEDLLKWKHATPDLLQLWVAEMESAGHGGKAAQIAEMFRQIADQ